MWHASEAAHWDLAAAEGQADERETVKRDDNNQLNGNKKNRRNLVSEKPNGKSNQEVMASSAMCW